MAGIDDIAAGIGQIAEAMHQTSQATTALAAGVGASHRRGNEVAKGLEHGANRFKTAR